MVGKLGGDGWGTLNPTEGAFTDGETETQALVEIAEIVEAAHNIHASDEGLRLLCQGT